jgi:hypothetical protein
VDQALNFAYGDLRTDEARVAFWKSVQDRFKIIQFYNDRIDARVRRTQDAAPSMESATAGESDTGTESIDVAAAAAMAGLAASQVTSEPALLRGLVDNLSNSAAAALLEGCRTIPL